MTLSHLTDKINNLSSSWETFKSLNEQRLKDIERKGFADPLLTEQLDRINDAIDNQKHRMEQFETAFKRPALASKASSGIINNSHNSEYKNAFNAYLRKGHDAGLEAFERKALSVGSDPDGGYLVTPTMSNTIVQTIFESSPMRQICSNETISSDSIELIEDRYEASSGWVTETAGRVDTSAPQVGKRSITVHELYAQPKATQKLLDDSAIDVESWIAEKVSDTFSRKENDAFINGDGVGKPRGFLTYQSGTTWGKIEQLNSGSSAAVTADKIIELFYLLKEPYMRGATFLMNRATTRLVRQLKETATGQYLWQPGLTAGAPDTLLGVPVVQAADMPIPAANSLSIAVGDFRQAYLIVDRVGVRTLRDPFTDKPFVKFYTTKRVGGDVVNYEAIKIMKLAN